MYSLYNNCDSDTQLSVHTMKLSEIIIGELHCINGQ